MPKKGFLLFIGVALLNSCLSTTPESDPITVDVETTDRGSSLHSLVSSGNETKIKEIFKIDTNINELDENGRSALHIASEKGDNQITMLLLSQGAKTDIQDKNGFTPLHIATANSHSEVTKTLCKFGANIFIEDNEGKTAYDNVSEKGIDNVKDIISDRTIKDVNSKGMSLLHLAAESGDLSTVELLLSKESNINLRDNSDFIPLDYALTNKDSEEHAKTAEFLIKNRSQNSKNKEYDYLYSVLKTDDIEFRFDHNKTALHIAAEKGHYGFAKLFIEKGIGLELKDSPGNTALHTAVVSSNHKIIDLLLNNSVDINARDFNNNTPLHLSLAVSYSDKIPTYLIQRGADVNAKESYGNTPLHLALSLKLDTPVSQLLIDSGADLTIRNKAGNTVLTEAVIRNNKAVALLLLNKKSEIYAKNDKGESPLSIGIQKGTTVLEWLMTTKNINLKNNDGDSPLIMAIRDKAPREIISFLIQKGANVNTRNKNGSTPLHEAIYIGNTEIINLLNEYRADFFAINNNGENSFDLIFKRGVEFAEKILSPELVALRNNRKNTPLFYAIDWGSPDIVQIVLDKGADINAKNINGETPLHQAVTTDNVVVANMLIDRGAAIEARDNQLNTPLHNCVIWNSYDIAHLLVENSADVNSKNIKKRTPLHDAVLTEQEETVAFFIKNSANIDLRDNNGQTPLFYAVKTNQANILNQLLGAGANINIRDTQGNTILHVAVFGKSSETAQILINKSSDLYAENKYGDTPVSIALSYGINTVSWFFTKDNINSMNNKGFTPLHFAVQNFSDPEVISYLVENGADIFSTNKDGETPYDLAKRLKYEVVEPLLK